jgi:hypothetical protein
MASGVAPHQVQRYSRIDLRWRNSDPNRAAHVNTREEGREIRWISRASYAGPSSVDYQQAKEIAPQGGAGLRDRWQHSVEGAEHDLWTGGHAVADLKQAIRVGL